MPKVYLRQAEREDAKETREMETLTILLRTARGRLGKQDRELAKTVGIHPGTFCNLKHPGAIAKTDLRTVRRLAHAVGCTADEWLKIGGFETTKGGPHP